MVDVRKIAVDGDNIVMTAKLMDAYSMKIYLTPSELRSSLGLLGMDLIKAIPNMLVTGTKSEETLRELGQKISSRNDENVKLLLGEDGLGKLKTVGNAIGLSTLSGLVEAILPLAQIVLEDKPPEKT